MEDEFVEIDFTKLEPLKIKLSRKLKYNELQELILSQFKIGQNKKRNLFNKNSFSKSRFESNNISSDKSIEIDLNEAIKSIFENMNNYNSIPSVPFIPPNQIEFLPEAEDTKKGSFGDVRKCKINNLKNRDNNKTEFGFKSYNTETNYSESDLLYKEVEVYSKLNHYAIPKFVGISYISEYKFGFLMEYIPGDNLSDCVDSIDKTDKLEYVRQLADVISYLHGNNIIHRDLKPNNIMIMKKDQNIEPRLFLIDYGLSKIQEKQKENELVSMMKSVFQNSPNVYRFLIEHEQLENEQSFDIWALGCIIYFLYTGKHPCGLNMARFNENIKQKINFFIVDEFDDPFIYEIIKDCCDLDPKKRKTAQEIRDKVFLRMNMKNNQSNIKIKFRLSNYQ